MNLPLLTIFITAGVLGMRCDMHAQQADYPAHIQTAVQRTTWDIGWPRFQGPEGSGGGVDAGYTLVDRLADAKLIWKSAVRLPAQEFSIKGHKGGCRTGFGSPVVANGRVFLCHSWARGLPACDDPAVGVQLQRLKHGQPGDDVVTCLDARTGALLWQKTFTNNGITLVGSGKEGGHLTMAVADNRCVAIGSGGDLYCLDSATGNVHWTTLVPNRTDKNGKVKPLNGVPVIVAGTVVIDCRGVLAGFDLQTGKKRWQLAGFKTGIRGSACLLAWRRAAGDLVIHEAGPTAIDPKDGTVLWRIETAHQVANTMALAGDTLVVGSDNDLRKAYKAGALDPDQATKAHYGPVCYDISPAGYKERWRLAPKFWCRPYCPPRIYQGHVYILSHYLYGRHYKRDGSKFDKSSTAEGPQYFVCVDLATGAVVQSWNHDDFGCTYAPVVAEGLWFYQGTFKRVAGSDSKDLSKGSRLSNLDASPAYVCGWVFLRTQHGIECWDLRR